jgi:hypothetical protein
MTKFCHLIPSMSSNSVTRGSPKHALHAESVETSSTSSTDKYNCNYKQGLNKVCGTMTVRFKIRSLPLRSLVHCTEKQIYVFPEMKLCDHIPNSYIHVSVRDLLFPGWVCLFGCSKIWRPILGICKSLTNKF